MDLPTYTNIWRIEKRLYKLYDFRLPMPLPINWIAVFVGITVPYIVFLIAIGLPFNHTLVWLYVLPPGLLTWLTTRPVIENKRLPELVESQVRYLTEPRVWTRLAPLSEKDQMVVTARVWHLRQAPQQRKVATARAAAGTVALRGRNALARRGVAATAIGDPAEGNAPLAAASALAAAPATPTNSRSRARARGTGPRVPAPGSSGRQRPPGKRTRPPRPDWAAQQREAAPHDELPEQTWPAEQPPRAQPTGPEDQAAKPSRFRLSALRSKPAGQAPELPLGVALRPAEPRRPRFGSLPPSDQEGSARSWPGGPDRPGQAAPAWRMPTIRSAPPLGSVAAPMSSDLPAHATPDVFPAFLPAPDAEPTTSPHAALPVHPALDIDPDGPVLAASGVYLSAPVLSPSPPTSTSAAPDEDQAPSVHAAQGVELDAPFLGLVSPEVAQDAPSSATTLDGEAAAPAPAAPELDPADQAPAAADVEPAISASASSEVDAASATPEVDSDAPPEALVGEPATRVQAAPEADPTSQALVASDVEPAISAPASPEAPGTPEVDPGPPPAALVGGLAAWTQAVPEADPDAQAPADPDVEPAMSASASSEADAASAAPEVDPAPLAAADAEPVILASASSEAHVTSATPEVDSDAPPVALVGESATRVHVVPEVDPAAPVPAAPDVEAAISAPATSEVHAASATPEVDPAAPAADVEPAIPAPASSEADAESATPEVDSDAPPVALVAKLATWVHVVPEVDPAAQAPAVSDVDQAPSAPSVAGLGPAAPAPGLGHVRSTPASAPSGGPPRVEISHDGPAQRLVPPAPVPPVNPALAWPSARPEPADLSLFPAALTTENRDKSQIPADVSAEERAEAPEAEAEEADEPRALEVVHEAAAAPQVPVVKAVADAVPLAVPSIERALSGPSKDRNLTWHGKVKIVAGTGQGPGKRDQEALDRARARLPLTTPQRVLMLGCTSGAGQSITTLMTGHILASLREEPVAAVDLHDGTLARYSAPAGWLDDLLSGRPPQGAMKARPDGLGPTPKTVPVRLDVIASRGPLRDGDELELAVQLTRHYSLAMLDPGAAGLMKLLKIADQLVIVVPASIDGAGALADTRDWLDTHGFAELADHSVTVINGVSRRSLADVAQAESVARGRCRAIVRVPWDDMLPVEIADPSALRPQTRVAYTALAGVLVAGMAAAPVRTSP